MKYIFSVIFFSFFLSFQVSAQLDKATRYHESKSFFLSGKLGLLKLEVKPEYYVGGDSELNTHNSLGLSIGYQFNSGIRFDAGKTLSLAYIDLFGGESYRLSESLFTISYRFPLSDIYILPGVGYSRYSLEIREGDFLIPSETQHEVEGSKSFVVFGMEIPLNNEAGIVLLYRDMDTEFGKIRGFSGGFYVAF